MENRILSRITGRLGAGRVDSAWLLTLLSVLEVERYTLDEWNEALSHAMGRRVFCPSYRSLAQYLHKLVLGVK